MSSITGERDDGHESRDGRDGRVGPDGRDGRVGSARVAGPGFCGFAPAGARVTVTDESRNVVHAARALAAVTTTALSDDECLGIYDDLELARRSLDAYAATIAADIDRRGLCDLRYGTRTTTWFARRHGRPRTAVSREIKTGKRLHTDLNVLHAAALRGEITFERAAFIANNVNDRNLNAFHAAQTALLDLSAAEPSWAQFTALITDIARYADADGGHDPTEPTSRASLRRVGNELVLDGTFVGTDAETFEQLVETETNRLWRQWHTDCHNCPELQMPTRNQIRAQAIIELTRRGVAADPSTTKPTVAEMSFVIDADRIDELDPILATALNPTHTHTGDCIGGGHCPTQRPGVGGLIGVPVSGTDRRQIWFTPSQWELLVCNADISEVILNQLAIPIAVRNRARFPNRNMRRALNIRDGGCVFPGCDAPTGWCDAHHVLEYDADHGDTVTTNLALLCRHHHGIIHRTGWSMRLTKPVTGPDPASTRDGTTNGFFTITTADGLELTTEHRRRQPAPA